jgi:uncharacterized membrane protein
MEVVLFILLVVLIILLVNMKNSLQDRLSEIETKINVISGKVSKLSEPKVQQKEDDKAIPAVTRKPDEVVKSPATVDDLFKSPSSQPTAVYDEPVVVNKDELAKSGKEEPIAGEEVTQTRKENLTATVEAPVKPPAPPQPPKPPKPGFFERNPDLEKFIGENLANKAGIAALVLGIGYFVKVAIDNDWIGVYGRVLIGILCGAILLILAHRMRKTFVSFSSVLVGGGIAVLYLTITIAFHEYQIIGQTAAFLLMVLITGFTILLSVSYNRIELAILALLGGFGSPFMVSTGEGNYVVLFTYILILDVGILVLAYFKRWNAVNVIAYVFTILLFGSWLAGRYDHTLHGTLLPFLFAVLFYVTFFAMNVINNLKERTMFKPLEISLLLSNTFLFYAAGMYILNNPSADMLKGLFTASIGVFNFAFAYALYKKANVDKNFVFLLIGIVLTFISLAAPVQLEGNYITLFWSAETVLLLWLSQQSGIRLMKIASVIVMGLSWISLAMDWNNIYMNGPAHLNVVLNKGYITSIVAVVSVALYRHFLRKEEQYPGLREALNPVLLFTAVLILYCSQLLELVHHLNFYLEHAAAKTVIVGSYNMLFIGGLILAEKRVAISERVKMLYPGLAVVAVVLYFAMYHARIIDARNEFVRGEAPLLGFAFHYVLVLILVVIAAWGVSRFRVMKEFNEYSYNLYSWFFVFFFLFIASAELDHTVVLSLNSGAESIASIISQNQKIGYPILWGISSFVLIAVGLRKKRRHLRIISLTVFLITLLKLFIFDIRQISTVGKTAALMSLGVLLLIVSFMYQKLKKFLLEDEVSDGNK